MDKDRNKAKITLGYFTLLSEFICGCFSLAFLIISARYHFHLSLGDYYWIQHWRFQLCLYWFPNISVLSHGSAVIILSIVNAVSILIVIFGIFAVIKQKSLLLKIVSNYDQINWHFRLFLINIEHFFQHAIALLIVAVITIGLANAVHDMTKTITHMNQNENTTDSNIKKASNFIMDNENTYFGVGSILITIQVTKCIC